MYTSDYEIFIQDEIVKLEKVLDPNCTYDDIMKEVKSQCYMRASQFNCYELKWRPLTENEVTSFLKEQECFDSAYVNIFQEEQRRASEEQQ
jgi:hypothetical protein